MTVRSIIIKKGLKLPILQKTLPVNQALELI